MLFNSREFALFFPLATVLYFLTPAAYRWLTLLIASCFFYMAFIPKYILVLVVLILFDYLAGVALERAPQPKRKIILACSILANVGFLAVFKYFNFAASNIAAIAASLGWNYSARHLSLLLPLGLSFHTFQSMSYTIEVYRGNQKAERHLGIFALYIMFYPQLVAGPIERPYNLLHQFREEHPFELSRVIDGLRLMLRGLFKKMVIADSLAIVVNRVFDHPKDFPAYGLIAAVYFFTFQIYCDFSGYTDIARGAARVMGFTLMENFDQPYLSKSLVEFWRRWHISLSSWFRDYLYIPLGGNRGSPTRHYFNLLIVFLVAGAWHGADWTFIIWGALHGIFMVALLSTEAARRTLAASWGLSERPRLSNFLSVLCTFHFVALDFVFFRAQSVGDALYILSHLVPRGALVIEPSFGRFPPLAVALGAVQIASLAALRLFERRNPMPKILAELSAWRRWSVYYLLIASLFALAFVSLNNFELTPQRFIYFQF
jgi:D-alanyl-lipoteichoic acid acyltransferase DltB (MBOAT superfamily)